MVKSCNNCGKSHRNRKENLCNECRPKKEYPLCKCLKHHVYYGDSCKDCSKNKLKTYSFV